MGLLDSLFSKLKLVILLVLSWLLPARGKRILFIASLQLRLQACGVFEEGALMKINQLLTLAHREDVLLYFPEPLQNVWGGEEIRSIVDDVEQCNASNLDLQASVDKMRSICDRIIDMAPNWMQYSGREKTRDDLLVMMSMMSVHPRMHAVA